MQTNCFGHEKAQKHKRVERVKRELSKSLIFVVFRFFMFNPFVFFVPKTNVLKSSCENFGNDGGHIARWN